MATFHPFPRLPFEIRAKIWRFSIEPRIVEVRAHRSSSLSQPGTSLHSTTAVPPSPQTCTEARDLGLYSQEFMDFTDTENPRYVWVNFDTDMISIGTTNVVHFEEYYSRIKRLRLASDDDKNEYWSRDEYHDLGYFINLEELHLVSLRGMCGMNLEYKPDFPCNLNITWIVDPVDGDMMTWRDVEHMEAIEDTYAQHRETASGYPEELVRVEKCAWNYQRLPTAAETRRWL